MPNTRVIKKYPNRRLYDTERGCYITLHEIKNYVIERIDFTIIDARTKKDLTQSTLLQIISEQEATSTPLFTTSLLQDFIRFYHEKSQSLLTKYLEQALDMFMQQKDFMNNQWSSYQKALSDPTFLEQAFKLKNFWPIPPQRPVAPDDTQTRAKPRNNKKIK